MDFLPRKIKKTREVLRRAVESWKPNIGLLWTTEIGSTVALYLTRGIFRDVPVLFVDTTLHFDETYEYRDRLVQLWGLNLTIVTPRGGYNQVKEDREECCRLLKSEPMLRKMRDVGLEALIVGSIWNQNPGSSEEDYFSEVDGTGIWPHQIVRPVLHWREADLWTFVKTRNIPYSPLYDRGYEIIDCEPCSGRKTIPQGGKSEENTRKILERLRALGYF
ncbi:MAG: phosphoadenosine phosphosulfate reductase family protein [Candidatus Bathyarchaeia archaeon]